MAKAKKENKTTDVYEQVNERLLDLLEKGEIPWVQTWIQRSTFNIVSGKQYSLLNRMILPRAGAYASYKQWSALGGQVRKGETSSRVFFWKMVSVNNNPEDTEDKNEKGNKPKIIPLLKHFAVFHVSQVDWPDGMPEKVQKILETKNPNIELTEKEKCEAAESIVTAYCKETGVKIQDGKDPCYNPGLDTVYCWPIEDFTNEAAYYGALFHELGHSTGHPSRLDRDQTGRFGSKNYAREELVAEISAGYMNTLLGISTDASMENHAAYIQSWKKAIAEDKKAFVVAAGRAEKAIDCLLCGKDISEYLESGKSDEEPKIEEPKPVIVTEPKPVHEQEVLFRKEPDVEVKYKAPAKKALEWVYKQTNGNQRLHYFEDVKVDDKPYIAVTDSYMMLCADPKMETPEMKEAKGPYTANASIVKYYEFEEKSYSLTVTEINEEINSMKQRSESLYETKAKQNKEMPVGFKFDERKFAVNSFRLRKAVDFLNLGKNDSVYFSFQKGKVTVKDTINNSYCGAIKVWNPETYNWAILVPIRIGEGKIREPLGWK